MKRRRNRRKRTENSQADRPPTWRSIEEIAGTAYSRTQANRTRAIDLVLCSFVGLLSFVFWDIYKPESLSRIPFFRDIFLMSLILVIIERLWSRHILRTTGNPRVVRDMLRWRTLLSSLALGLFAFPVIYFSGFPDWVATFVVRLVPSIGTRLARFGSKVLTVLISGGWGIIGNLCLTLIGNFIYDLLKKLYVRRKT